MTRLRVQVWDEEGEVASCTVTPLSSVVVRVEGWDSDGARPRRYYLVEGWRGPWLPLLGHLLSRDAEPEAFVPPEEDPAHEYFCPNGHPIPRLPRKKHPVWCRQCQRMVN
jgi:hypothetical protein